LPFETHFEIVGVRSGNPHAVNILLTGANPLPPPVNGSKRYPGRSEYQVPGDLIGEGRLLKCAHPLAVFPALRAFGLQLLGGVLYLRVT